MFARNIISPYAFSFFIFPSKKELCMGSKALLTTLNKSQSLPCQSPRPYHSPFKPSDNCLSVHPGVFLWFWWHQGLHLQEDGRKCISLNPFLIALRGSVQRRNSGPVDYLKMKRPSLHHGCFFMKLFPSTLATLERWGFAKIHFCQNYNQNKRFVVKINPNSLPCSFFQQLEGISDRNYPNTHALKIHGPIAQQDIWEQPQSLNTTLGRERLNILHTKNMDLGDTKCSGIFRELVINYGEERR